MVIWAQRKDARSRHSMEEVAETMEVVEEEVVVVVSAVHGPAASAGCL